MHLSSLPGLYGSGGLGPDAEKFANFLKDAGFGLWQVLPVTPTDSASGFSPYSGTSAFAGNVHFVSPEMLLEDGLVTREEAEGYTYRGDSKKSDFFFSQNARRSLIEISHKRMMDKAECFQVLREAYNDFAEAEKAWLEDYALFAVLKGTFAGLPWNEWPKDFMRRDPAALEEFKTNGENSDKINLIKFEQFLFDRQWKDFHRYCLERDIALMGDVPMFVAYDSADVWSHTEYFDLAPDFSPNEVAGVPPDYFSCSGQRWGNPLYRWEKMKEDGYSWWTARFRKTLSHFDLLRIDHFRGFCSCWSIPSCETTAINGRWTDSPGEELINAIKAAFRESDLSRLPLVAEDLGIITDDVKELMDAFGLPGMKVLLFAFDGETGSSPYAPHSHIPKSVVYTGTHDNNTVRGWWEEEADERTKALVSEYTGHRVTEEDAAEVFVRMALASVSELAIVPMQDILGLGAESRMNVPGTPEGNWTWRLGGGDMDGLTLSDSKVADRMKRMNRLYGRRRGNL